MAITYTKAEIDAILAPILASLSSGMHIEGIWNWAGYGNATPNKTNLSADAAPVNATELYFNKEDAYKKVFTSIMAMLGSNCQVWAQSVDDNSAWIKYQCEGAPTQVGDVVTIPVSVIASGPTSVANWTKVRVLFVTALA